MIKVPGLVVGKGGPEGRAGVHADVLLGPAGVDAVELPVLVAGHEGPEATASVEAAALHGEDEVVLHGLVVGPVCQAPRQGLTRTCSEGPGSRT